MKNYFKTLWKKFKTLIIAIVVFLLLIVMLLCKSNKIADLIARLRRQEIDNEEDNIQGNINELEKEKQDKIKDTDNDSKEDLADFFNGRSK
jgi:hypothetical protein